MYHLVFSIAKVRIIWFNYVGDNSEKCVNVCVHALVGEREREKERWIMQTCQHCVCSEFFRCLAQFKSLLWVIYNLLYYHAFVLNYVTFSGNIFESLACLSCSPWQPAFCILATVLWIQIQAALWLHATYANTIKSEYQIGNNTQPNVQLSKISIFSLINMKSFNWSL